MKYITKTFCGIVTDILLQNMLYRQTSDISHTKSHNFNVSRLVLQLYLPYPLKPSVYSAMKL